MDVDQLLKKYNNSWEHIAMEEPLSEDFIREFKDKVDWWHISAFQKLSEDFIREFKDKVNWTFISYHQVLSEDFIREFEHKVEWIFIYFRQELSEYFIREFKGKMSNEICWFNVLTYEQGYNISLRLIKEFVDYKVFKKVFCT